MSPMHSTGSARSVHSRNQVSFGDVAQVQTEVEPVPPPPLEDQAASPPAAPTVPASFHPPTIFSTLELQVVGERASVETWTLLLLCVSMLQYLAAPYELTCGQLASLHGVLKIAHNYFSLWAVFLSIPVIWQKFYQEQLFEFCVEYRLQAQLGIYLQSWIFHQSVERFYRYILLEGVLGDLLYIYLMLRFDTSFIFAPDSHLPAAKSASLDVHRCSFGQNVLAVIFIVFYFYHWMVSVLLLLSLSKARKLVARIHEQMQRPIPTPQQDALKEEWMEWQPGFNEIIIVAYYLMHKGQHSKLYLRAKRLMSVFVKEWRESEAAGGGVRGH